MRFTAAEEDDVDGALDDRYQPMAAFIRSFIQDHGYSPSVREMQESLGHTSTSVTAYWMQALRRDGRITFVDNQSRTVRPVGGDVIDVVLHLTRDEARLVRAWTTDPKATLLDAIREMARGHGHPARR